MITRRHFIHASTVAAASAGYSAEESESTLFSVGLIADAQYVDADPGGIRHYRNSIEKLRNASRAINESEVDFSIHLGDLIDRDFDSFDAILEPLSELRSPVYQIPGNHDFSVEDEKKSDVLTRLGMKSPYHSFSKEGFRFVFLDGTEISTFAALKGSENHELASQLLTESKAEGRKNAKPWNGGLGAGQMKWLENQLKEAAAAGEKVILSCHYPILPDNSHNLLNDREALALVDQFSDTVAVWFNGHNHAGNYAERNGVHFVTIEGMVDTPDTNAFAVLDVAPHSLTIRGSGRVPDRILSLK